MNTATDTVMLWLRATGEESPVRSIVRAFYDEMNQNGCDYFNDGTLEEFTDKYRSAVRERVWDAFLALGHDYAEPVTYLSVLTTRAVLLQCDWAVIIRQVVGDEGLVFLEVGE